MDTKKSVEQRIRGWFPQETKLPKTQNSIKLQAQLQPLYKNRLVWGRIGGVVAVLIAIGAVFVGLIFSDALRSFNIYAMGEQNPQAMALTEYVLGGIGFAAGILGIIGSKIGKQRGGILLIIAGVTVLVTFFFIGILPGILMLVSGATELGNRQLSPPKPLPHNKHKEHGEVLAFFLERAWQGRL
ncbi:MAG: DUF4064 domain-containing protein [Candidatus Bathyarchaeia archaeon]